MRDAGSVRCTRLWSRACVRLLLLGMPVLTGCASGTMNAYVPAHCHGVAEPFSTYTIEYHAMPAFIHGVIDTSLHGALARAGLSEAEADAADIRMRVELEVIERHNEPTWSDPMGEPVAPNELHRFVTHLTLDLQDRRTGELIWTGAVDRAHAIRGGETFHNERAVLLISNTFDAMFVGLTEPCG